MFSKDLGVSLQDAINRLPNAEFKEFKQQINADLKSKTTSGQASESGQTLSTGEITNRQEKLIFDSDNTPPAVLERLNQIGENFQYGSFASLQLKLLKEDSFAENLNAYRYKTVNELLEVGDYKSKLEILIRFVNSITVYLLTYLAFVFGRVNPRQSRNANLIISISLYLIYMLLLNSLKSVISKGGNLTGILNAFIAINILYIFLI